MSRQGPTDDREPLQRAALTADALRREADCAPNTTRWGGKLAFRLTPEASDERIGLASMAVVDSDLPD